MSQISDSPRWMQSRTGGLSLLALLLLIAGLGCLIVQVGLIAGGRFSELQPAARFLPGVIGLAFLVLFWLRGMRKGDIAVHRDGIVGRSKGGRKYAYSWAEIGSIDLMGRMLHLRKPDGKKLLIDSPPNEKGLRGLIWLRLNTQFSAAFWEHFAQAPEAQVVPAHRQFLDAEGNASFLDSGFVLHAGELELYFPESDTVAIPKKIAHDQNLSTTLMPSGMVLKFDPNPGELPIRRLCGALQSVRMEEKLRFSAFQQLNIQHGGALLTANPAGWEGETSGWKVQIVPIES